MRVEELAVARSENRPAPVYVIGSQGSGSHLLTTMMAAALPVIDLQEAPLPADLVDRLDRLRADEQGVVVDCLHLSYALALRPDIAPADAIEVRMLSSAVQAIEPRHRLWDPECFAIHLLRDPREQVACIAFRERGLRERYYPAMSDNQFLTACADHVAYHLAKVRRSPVQTDFVCRYEELRASEPEVLVRLAAALGHPIEVDAATHTAAENQDWRAETDEHQKLVLHSNLAGAVTSAGYPADDCLGRPLEFEAAPTERRLRFGKAGGLGVLFAREDPTPHGNGKAWARFADACGEVVVPGGLALKLRVNDSAPREAIASLAELGPDDLDSLCLAGNPTIDDELLVAILSSLDRIQELDLARTAVTYAALPTLTALPCLRGLSVAETELGPSDILDLRTALGPAAVVGDLPLPVAKAVGLRRTRGSRAQSAPPKAVITGCPRSGTGYVATVLAWAGVASGHESVYGPRGFESWDCVTVEVSWLAAPSLPVEGIPAAHQVRNPLAVVRSLVGTRFFTKPTIYRKFAEDACPGLREEPTPVSAAVRMWCEWTRMAEAHSVARWRVEDMAREAERIAALTGAPLDRLRQMIECAPQDVNHRRRASDLDLASVPGELWSEFEAIAADFGYEVSR